MSCSFGIEGHQCNLHVERSGMLVRRSEEEYRGKTCVSSVRIFALEQRVRLRAGVLVMVVLTPYGGNEEFKRRESTNYESSYNF